MSEAALQVVQVGRESATGTSVAATQIFPLDQGSFSGFELDRASESPDEDYGGVSRERAGRASTGVRGATASATQTMCFEDFQKICEMHFDTITAPTGTAITLSTSAEADDIIDTAAPHGRAAGDMVSFSALTGGNGLTTNRIYYVIAANLAAQTLQVSTTSGGSAVDFSTDITAGTMQTGTFSWVYVPDETTGLLDTALKPYTWEYGDPASTQDEYEAVSVLISELTIGFDALSAPGNQMWKANLNLIGVDRVPAAMTSALSAPATRETMEGHLTTFAEGSTSTAFGSLSALGSSLKQFSLTSNIQAILRSYGGSSDKATSIGRSGKATVSGSALIAMSSTSKTDIQDIFDVAGSVPTERRWRITVDGSGVNAMTIDLRPRFTRVDRGEHEGEILYAVEFEGVYDSILASRVTATLTNAVAAHV